MSLGRYLGASFSSQKPKKIDYNNIMQKDETRINSWHANFLSKAGRGILIQANLEALPVYICSSVLLPKKTFSQLDSVHRNFLLEANDTVHPALIHPLIAWDKICQPKSKGGLGFGKTRPLNNTFISSLVGKSLTTIEVYGSPLLDKNTYITPLFSVVNLMN